MYIPTGKELIDPFKVLEDSGIRDGMTVADFGCGTLGHYVFPAARLVGERGKVYAIDILKSVLGGIESRAKIEAASNVGMIWGDIERLKGIPVPEESVDLGLLINNLFLSTQKEAMFRECARVVKHGGIFVVIDWKPAGASFGPPPASRVSVDEAKRLAATAGLTVQKDIVPGKYHYGFVCAKP